MADENKTQVSVGFTADQLARITVMQETEQRRVGQTRRVTRGEILREIVERGLEHSERAILRAQGDERRARAAGRRP